MSPWKSLVRTSAGRQWAESVLAGADPMGLVKSKPILRLHLQNIVASTSKAVGRFMSKPGSFFSSHPPWTNGKQWWTKQMY
eukprot:6476174-Amphidinium_carterae.2